MKLMDIYNKYLMEQELKDVAIFKKSLVIGFVSCVFLTIFKLFMFDHIKECLRKKIDVMGYLAHALSRIDNL